MLNTILRADARPSPPASRLAAFAAFAATNLAYCIAAASLTLVITLLLNFSYLRVFTVQGDDYAVLGNSAHQLSPDASGWLRDGWSGYFTDYPEADSDISNFVRPVVNASVYIDSWISASPDSPLMLTGNYLGHAICVALVFLIARRVFSLPKQAALLAAALFAGSVATHNLHASIAFRGDMLGALFTLSAILLASYVRESERPGLLALAISAFVLLALFTKETAWVAPAAVAIVLITKDGRLWPHRLFSQRNAPTMLGLILAGLLLVAARVHAGLGGIYVADDMPSNVMGVPLSVLNPLRFAATAFYPIETDFFKQAIDGGQRTDPQFLLAGLHAVVALAINAIGWLLIADAALRRERRLLPLGLLVLVISAVPIVVKADPRFMYLSQAFTLPFLVWLLLQLKLQFPPWHRVQRAFVLAPLVLLIAGPLYVAVQIAADQPSLVAGARESRELSDVLSAQLADLQIKRIYMVNTPEGTGLAALQFRAEMAGRNDVELRLVNTLEGDSDTAASGMAFELDGEALAVAIDIAPSQRFFGYMDEIEAAKLGKRGVIEYTPISEFKTNSWGKTRVSQKHLRFLIPDAARNDYVILGFDPASSGVHVYNPAIGPWQPAR